MVDPADACGGLRACRPDLWGGYLHHCFSHGMPSLLPSILVPGQLLRKKFASAQEVICEQWVRPSQWYGDVACSLGTGGRGARRSGACNVSPAVGSGRGMRA